MNELSDLCLFRTKRELPFPEQAFGAHYMRNEDLLTVKTIEDAAKRLDNLAMT